MGVCNQIVKCKFTGRDRDDGYPVCKHPDARKYCDKGIDNITDEDMEDGCHPAQVAMSACPLVLWRFSGDARIPVWQSLLIEYEQHTKPIPDKKEEMILNPIRHVDGD